MATKAHIGAYGKPLSKKAGSTLPLTRIQMDRAGEIILAEIRNEIRIDAAKAAGTRKPGAPVPIPLSPEFAKSFKVRIRGSSTIEITSDWPTAGAHTTPASKIDVLNPHSPRSGPIEMKWLARPAVPYARIVQSNGVVIVRTTPDPMQGEQYWMHPGFRKYTFLERGLRKGREKVAQELAKELIEQLLQTTNIFE